jgi:hypothetical protein
MFSPSAVGMTLRRALNQGVFDALALSVRGTVCDVVDATAPFQPIASVERDLWLTVFESIKTL